MYVTGSHYFGQVRHRSPRNFHASLLCLSLSHQICCECHYYKAWTGKVLKQYLNPSFCKPDFFFFIISSKVNRGVLGNKSKDDIFESVIIEPQEYAPLQKGLKWERIGKVRF